MPSEKKHVTQIVVTEQKVIHEGTNRNGGKYTIRQLIATNRNGQLIDLNLRSFDELPLKQLITVEVEKFKSDRFGDSYTVTLEGKKKGAGLGKKVNDLEARVKTLESQLAALARQVNGGAALQAPAAQAQQGPPAQQLPGPPQQKPEGDGLPSDDIPF